MPCKIPQEGFDGAAVEMVATGSGHTAAICSDLSLWTWGAGVQGALGHNDTNSRLVPTRVKATRLKAGVAQVSCGGDHSAAVDVDGNLYTWGLGDAGLASSAPPFMCTSLFDCIVTWTNIATASTTTHAASLLRFDPLFECGINNK